MVTGVGLDIWERTLSARQNETYAVAFLRMGVDYGMRAARGWFWGGATFAIVQPKSSMDVLGLRLAITF